MGHFTWVDPGLWPAKHCLLPWSLRQRSLSACIGAPGLKGGFVCSVLKTSFTLEVPAFLPTLDSSRCFFYASLAFLLYLAGWLTWKWSLCSPRQSWHCSWLSKQLLAGPAILLMPRWMREPHSEFRVEVGKAAEHISSQKNKTCGPKELGSLCFLPCPLKSWGGGRSWCLGLRMSYWKRRKWGEWGPWKPEAGDRQCGSFCLLPNSQINLLGFSISHGSFIFFNKIGDSLRSIASVLNIFVLKVIVHPWGFFAREKVLLSGLAWGLSSFSLL